MHLISAKLETVLLVVILTSVHYAVGQKKGILYPRDTESRQTKSLDGIWNFRAEPKGAKDLGLNEEWFKQPLEKTGEVEFMAVPSSYQDLSNDRDRLNFLGWVWYDRDFWVPPGWSPTEKRVFLRFGSVNYHAIVWINGVKAMEHRGGHLPFEAELTEQHISFDKPNLITVAVNNTLTPATVPQGFVNFKTGDKYPPGHVIMTGNFDFFNYAGIHRSVVLYTTPRSFIDDITVVSDVLGTDGIVNFTIDSIIENEDNARVNVYIYDKEGNIEAFHLGPAPGAGSLVVTNAKLWWPYTMVSDISDAGYLYTLEVQLINGEVSDVYRMKIGIRTVKVTDDSFRINDKPFYFTGFGRHEDFLLRGRGFDPVVLIKDHNLIRWTGANAYRTTHYPYSEELMDVTDQLGIVIIDECSAVSLTLFGTDLLATHKQDITEMIHRDKNRASVLVWSLANEPRSHEEVAENYFKEIFEHARALDNSRPFTYITDRQYDQDKATQFVDFICLNRYHGWYNDAGELEMIETAISSEAYNWMNKFKKPLLITEYGADTIAGLHMSPSWLFTEEFQEDYMREHFKAFDKMRKNTTVTFIGEMIWNFADFMTFQEIRRVVGNRKGIFTRERQPKASAHLLRSRYHLLANEFYGYPVPEDLHQSMPVYIPPGAKKDQISYQCPA